MNIWYVLKRKIDGCFLCRSGAYEKVKKGIIVPGDTVAFYGEKDVQDYAKLWGAVFEFVKLDIGANGYYVIP